MAGVGAETAADLVREARGRAIDAIMAGLAGSAAACEALADCAVTTPVDLLARSARSIAVELRIAAGNAGCAWDEDAVGRWQQAAERALRHHPWLEQWVYAADWE